MTADNAPEQLRAAIQALEKAAANRTLMTGLSLGIWPASHLSRQGISSEFASVVIWNLSVGSVLGEAVD